jgi:hypothetical protein
MTDTIVVTPVLQTVTVTPIDQTVTISTQGPQGPQGATGSSGVVSVTAPITNSGTSTAANLGLSYTQLTIDGGTP